MLTLTPTRTVNWYLLGVGVLFLVVALAMLGVFLYATIPQGNEKTVSLICGSIMTAAVVALNNLARGSSDSETEIESLKKQIVSLTMEINALKESNAELRNMNKFLVQHMTDFEKGAEVRTQQRIEDMT